LKVLNCFLSINKTFNKLRQTPQIDFNQFYEQQPSCQISQLDSLLQIFLGRRDDGVFVEIGANDGVSCSNTWGLAKRGWTGYLVEAVPEFAEICKENHKEHKNISIWQVAIGDEDGAEVTFNIGGQLSTANHDLQLEYKSTAWAKSVITTKQVVIKTQKLDTFLRDKKIQPGFDVLVVDVEGYEAQVFSGFILSEWNPKMLIVELTDTHPHLKTNSKSDAALGQSILSKGYEIVYKDCINTVFVTTNIWKDTFQA
jgi:FkbM family methyltransferase